MADEDKAAQQRQNLKDLIKEALNEHLADQIAAEDKRVAEEKEKEQKTPFSGIFGGLFQ